MKGAEISSFFYAFTFLQYEYIYVVIDQKTLLMQKTLEQLRFPIGHFESPAEITQEHIQKWIEEIQTLPDRLIQLTESLDNNQLETPYRPGGWTIRQTIHHIGDSHTNSYIRFKWTLTEDKPIIKAYFEDRWAELFDTKDAPIELSLFYIKALHAKWVYLLKSLNEEQLSRSFIHPETNEEVSLKKNIGIYAWHGNHHYAHIENILSEKGWL